MSLDNETGNITHRRRIQNSVDSGENDREKGSLDKNS